MLWKGCPEAVDIWFYVLAKLDFTCQIGAVGSQLVHAAHYGQFREQENWFKVFYRLCN